MIKYVRVQLWHHFWIHRNGETTFFIHSAKPNVTITIVIIVIAMIHIQQTLSLIINNQYHYYL